MGRGLTGGKHKTDRKIIRKSHPRRKKADPLRKEGRKEACSHRKRGDARPGRVEEGGLNKSAVGKKEGSFFF